MKKVESWFCNMTETEKEVLHKQIINSIEQIIDESLEIEEILSIKIICKVKRKTREISIENNAISYK